MSDFEDLSEIFEACVISGIYPLGEKKTRKLTLEESLDYIVTEKDVKELASLTKVGSDNPHFASEVETMFQNCREEEDAAAGGDPREIDFPKLLGELEKLFPDPVDCFDIERAFAVLDVNKNGNVSKDEMRNGIKHFTQNGMRGIEVDEVDELFDFLVKRSQHPDVELSSSHALAISRKSSKKSLIDPSEVRNIVEEEEGSGFTIDAMLSTLEPPPESREL